MPTVLNDTGRHSVGGLWDHHQLLATAYGVVCVVSLAESVVAGGLLLWRLKRSGPVSVLLLSMTAGAATFSCALPLKIHYHLHGGDWHFGEPACRGSAALHWAFMYLSTTSLFCLCLDSCLALAYPFARLWLHRIHWAVGSAALWVLAGVAASPLALGGPLSWTNPDNRTSCFEDFVEDVGSGSYGTYALVGGFLLPCTIILGGYPLLAWHVASGQRTWRCRRARRTLCFSFLLCATCFLPYSLTHLLRRLVGPTGPTPFLRHLRGVTLLLLGLGSCLSPIICLPRVSRAGCRLWARLRPSRPNKIFTIYDSGLVEGPCQALRGRGQHGSCGDTQAEEMGLGVSGNRCPQEAAVAPGGLH
ncbi:proteinase-activated receptor 4-like [Dromiciops gliroides]|uniref:proteinase-activated receptor 4-like n=1 Tax=Dromiciops gliroides TaxID=33562 RepID=UPI001CC469B8|nr:proteinase-activated receptor 4-like [Dromiciops gliroides]